MRTPRRRFLRASAVATLLARLLPASAASTSSAADATLRAYIDALIPADETPSGSALGVDRQLRDAAAGQRDYHDLLVRGTAWLDREAQAKYGRSFVKLGDEQRDAILRRAASADQRTLARVFFERTRADAFYFYYGKRQSWRGLHHYRGAPQPAGFPAYDRAPDEPK